MKKKSQKIFKWPTPFYRRVHIKGKRRKPGRYAWRQILPDVLIEQILGTLIEKQVIKEREKARPKKRRVVREKPPTFAAWQSVREYQDELQGEFEFLQADPIYRFDLDSDVIHLSSRFVWGSPLAADMDGPKFPKRIAYWRGVRMWFIVEKTNAEHFQLWARSIAFDKRVETWAQLHAERKRLAEKFIDETARLNYIEFHSVAAWTAYAAIADKEGSVPLSEAVGGYMVPIHSDGKRPGQEIMPGGKTVGAKTRKRKPKTKAKSIKRIPTHRRMKRKSFKRFRR